MTVDLTSDPAFRRELKEAMGEFVMAHSAVEQLVTAFLIRVYDLDPETGYVLVQGMSFGVKLRKLKVMLRRRQGPLLSLLGHLEKVNDFRDRLLHWGKFPREGARLLELKDAGRNPDDIIAVQLTISVPELRAVSRWLGEVQGALFVAATNVPGKDPISFANTLVPQEAPPIPKGQ